MTQVDSGTATNGDVQLPWVRTANPGGAPLLLVNGLGSPLVAYEDGFVAELVDRGFEIVRFDNRDAGRATATQGGYKLIDMANDAAAVLDAVGWKQAHVFGMSMGGMIVQQLGISFPQRLLSLTSVMSTTGNPEFGRASDAARKALLTPAPTDRDGWLAARILSDQVWASPAQWTPEASRAKGEMMFDYGVQPKSVTNQYQAIVSSGQREDELRQVAVPTLVLHGSEDTLIDPSGGVRTAEIMSNASYIEIEGMGHDIPEAYWAPIAGHVAAFALA